MIKRVVFVGLAVTAIALDAMANAGTPLMWRGFLFLIEGNLLIGMFEGLLLALVFRLRIWRTISLMVAANYFSAYVGLFSLERLVPYLPSDVHNVMDLIRIMVVGTFLASLLLEFPFVFLAFRKQTHWFAKAAVGFLVVQTISYVLIFGWFERGSPISFVTDTELVEAAAIDLPKEIRIYFIAAEDGDVYTVTSANRVPAYAFELDSKNRADALAVRPSSAERSRWDTCRWELMAFLTQDNPRKNWDQVFPATFAADAVPREDLQATGQYDPWLPSWQTTLRFDASESSEWEFRAGYWASEGLNVRRKDSDSKKRLAFETPFAQWTVHSVVHLPGDIALFQLGEDQICLYDPETNRIALLARGRGPTAVIEETSPK